MNTTYKAPASVISPFQPLREKAFNAQKDKKPSAVRAEIEKNIGTFNLTATIEEDTQTLSMFKHIPGLVAFICTLKKGEQVLANGRGTSVINKLNKYIERTVRYAFNASFIDAAVRSVKILDAMYVDENSPQGAGVALAEAYKEKEIVEARENDNGITEKQEKYLRQLISQNIENAEARDEYMSQIPELSRGEASSLIQGFSK